jgi:hypothetical protein
MQQISLHAELTSLSQGLNLFRYVQMVSWSVEGARMEGRLTKVAVKKRTQENEGLLEYETNVLNT